MVVNKRGRKRNADVAYYHLRRTAVTTCLLAVPNHNLLWRIKLSEGTRPHDHEAAAAGHSRRAEVSRSRLTPHNAPARDGIPFLIARRVNAMSASVRALECPGLRAGSHWGTGTTGTIPAAPIRRWRPRKERGPAREPLGRLSAGRRGCRFGLSETGVRAFAVTPLLSRCSQPLHI